MSGFSMPNSPISYESAYEAFEWNIPEYYNISEAVTQHINEDSENIALRHTDESGSTYKFSFADLDQAANTLAANLAADGINSGDRVGLCFPQCPEHLIAHLAVFKLGGISVPISSLLGTDSIEHILRHSGSKAFLHDIALRNRGIAEVTFPQNIEIQVQAPVGKGDYSRGPLGGFKEYAVHTGTVRAQRTAPDSPAIILYTSGTTGEPKGVLQSHQYLLGSLPGFRMWYQLFDPNELSSQRIWSPSEWAWAGALFGVVFPTLAIGSTVASRTRYQKFNPTNALNYISNHEITRMFMPPTAFNKIRNDVNFTHVDVSFPRLEVIQIGGERVSPALKEWIKLRFGAVVNEAYGQTEANALIGHSQSVYQGPNGAMGRPYPGHEIELRDEDGEPVPDGTPGEICVCLPDPVVFIGYWNDEEKTNAKFTADGSLRTGDLALRDDKGNFWHRGRMDDLIITSGYRASPAEIEEVIESHGDVLEAYVGGVSDDLRGMKIKAYVIPVPDVILNEDLRIILRELVSARLGPHKRPHQIEMLSNIPRTRTGKIDRSRLFGENHHGDIN